MFLNKAFAIDYLISFTSFSFSFFFICSAFCTGPGLLGKIFWGPKRVDFQLWRVEILISCGQGEWLWFKRAPVDFLSGFPTHQSYMGRFPLPKHRENLSGLYCKGIPLHLACVTQNTSPALAPLCNKADGFLSGSEDTSPPGK